MREYLQEISFFPSKNCLSFLSQKFCEENAVFSIKTPKRFEIYPRFTNDVYSCYKFKTCNSDTPWQRILTVDVINLSSYVTFSKKCFLMCNLYSSYMTYTLRVKDDTILVMSFCISVKNSLDGSFETRKFTGWNLLPNIRTLVVEHLYQ